MEYPGYWRPACAGAFLLHLTAGFLLTCAAPRFADPMSDGSAIQEIEWIDAAEIPSDLSSGSQISGMPVETVGVIVASDIVSGGITPGMSDEIQEGILDEGIPDEKMTTTADVQPQEQPAVESHGAVVNARAAAANATDILNMIQQAEREGKNIGSRFILVNGTGKTEMGGTGIAESAQLIKPFYPPPGIVSFEGRVSVSARIGTDGKIQSVKIIVSSGSPLADAVALDAAKRWVYKPAADGSGSPMECDAVIIIPFQRFSE